MSKDIYQKWRESEAYAEPMTEDGVKFSQHRWRGFNMGYKQAMKDVINLIKAEHSWELPDSPTVFEFVQFIEDKIKEKNNG